MVNRENKIKKMEESISELQTKVLSVNAGGQFSAELWIGCRLGSLRSRQQQVEMRLRSKRSWSTTLNGKSWLGGSQLHQKWRYVLYRYQLSNQANCVRHQAFEPEEDEEKGFMVEVQEEYDTQDSEHVSLVEGSTLFVSKWDVFEVHRCFIALCSSQLSGARTK